MTLDPVTLAVIQNGLRQVASEMDLVHEKTSFSPVISEGFDRSNGIYDRATGDVVAQGELGLPIFVGVMQFTTQAVIERRRDLEPGDVILVNDPYLGGTHLMDVKMVRPFYYRSRLWCYLSNTGHWPDTGGMVPGGTALPAPFAAGLSGSRSRAPVRPFAARLAARPIMYPSNQLPLCACVPTASTCGCPSAGGCSPSLSSLFWAASFTPVSGALSRR